MDFSNDELWVIKDALLTARAREETEYLETEKRILDSRISGKHFLW
jgi:hypothetical protein